MTLPGSETVIRGEPEKREGPLRLDQQHVGVKRRETDGHYRLSALNLKDREKGNEGKRRTSFCNSFGKRTILWVPRDRARRGFARGQPLVARCALPRKEAK